MRNKEEIQILEVLEEEHINAMMNQREKEREAAKGTILRIQEENCRHFNNKRKVTHSHKKGDLIAIQRTQFGKGLKLCPMLHVRRTKIIKVKRNNRYEDRKVGQHEGPNMSQCIT